MFCGVLAYVQSLNPMSKEYILIDKEIGSLIARSESKFPNVSVVEKCGKVIQ